MSCGCAGQTSQNATSSCGPQFVYSWLTFVAPCRSTYYCVPCNTCSLTPGELDALEQSVDSKLSELAADMVCESKQFGTSQVVAIQAQMRRIFLLAEALKSPAKRCENVRVLKRVLSAP